MSARGTSGSAVASHTPIVSLGGTNLAISPAQMRIVRLAQSRGGSIHISGRDVRGARILESLKVGTLTDDGHLAPGGRVDGERWSFTVAPGVVIVEGAAS